MDPWATAENEPGTAELMKWYELAQVGNGGFSIPCDDSRQVSYSLQKDNRGCMQQTVNYSDFHIPDTPYNISADHNRYDTGSSNNYWVYLRGFRLLSVYPRWRGEHNGTQYRACNITGLSPLARGTLGVFNFNKRRTRFIPAGAGNTRHYHALRLVSTVYPRLYSP